MKREKTFFEEQQDALGEISHNDEEYKRLYALRELLENESFEGETEEHSEAVKNSLTIMLYDLKAKNEALALKYFALPKHVPFVRSYEMEKFEYPIYHKEKNHAKQ